MADASIADRLQAEFAARGAHFCTPEEQEAVLRLCYPERQPGRAQRRHRRPVGARPRDDGRLQRCRPATRALVVRPAGVGADHPLSHELLCPILKWYVARARTRRCGPPTRC